MSAAVITFPRAAAPRPVEMPSTPRRSLQRQVNEAAATGYWWGVQDTLIYVPVAFIAGVCLAFMVVP